jgi:hypothetical protein
VEREGLGRRARIGAPRLPLLLACRQGSEEVPSLLALLLALLSQFTCFTVACVGRGARRCSVYVLLLVQKKGKC